MLCIVVGDIVCKAWAELSAEQKILGKYPVVGVAEIDVIIVVDNGIEEQGLVDIR